MKLAATDNFRINLATAMEARNLSKVAVAKAANTSRSYLDYVLSGKADPSISKAEELSKAVGFPFVALCASPKDFSDSVLTSVR